MTNQGISFIKFLFDRDWEVLESTLMGIDSQVLSYQSVPELMNLIQGSDRAYLIACSLRSKGDVLRIATLVKQLKKLECRPGLKLVVIDFSKNKAFELALQKVGIQEIVSPEITVKSLRFKINLWLSALRALNQKEDREELVVIKSSNVLAFPSSHEKEACEIEKITESASSSVGLIQDGVARSCQVDDYFDQMLMLRLPDAQVGMGPAIVDMTFEYQGKIRSLNFTGTIVELNDLGEEKIVTLKVPDQEVVGLESILRLYQSRQENVNLFLEKVRGF